MKTVYGIAAVLVLLGVAAGGYWMGAHAPEMSAETDAAKGERKVLYYRNPMGLPDTSPVPKKDSMGMDYVPVYEGDEPASAFVDISPDRVQMLGVKSEAAAMRVLDRTLRAVGRIEADERHTYAISPKFEGWVEKLYVNTTGQTVAKGQPLFEVYSPELLSAQRERAIAVQGMEALKEADDEAKDGMRRLAESSAARLRNWDVANARTSGNRITFHAPVSGVVLEKKALQGMRFMPGEELYRIADLSTVWVIADMPEQDAGRVGVGGRAVVTVDAYPGRRFEGKVDFVYPTLDVATRTVRARIVLANPQGELKPAMYAQVELPVEGGTEALSVPASAVIDSGVRQVVLVQLAQGRFEPREVRLGRRGVEYVEVLEGVANGEQVVTSANFLIDAESNLRAALNGMGAAAAGAKSAGEKPAQPERQTVGHQGRGTLEGINPDGTLSIVHEPIPSLGWPGMTMDFELANSSLAAGIQPGSTVTFELVERGEGEWVITKIAAAPAAHEGH